MLLDFFRFKLKAIEDRDQIGQVATSEEFKRASCAALNPADPFQRREYVHSSATSQVNDTSLGCFVPAS